MKLSKEEIEKLAHLARLEFAENELEQMKADLEKILAFVGRIDALNLEDVEPLIYMNKEVDKLRADEAKLELTKEDALKNAPDRDSDYFRVPKVLKTD
ncbi:MAG: Glutamyl-tRNA(Gln) amidotransferase subunit C [Flavobacteriia bacterium]|nr:MAG: Glutamyl-tRNA(Gln) amidotransferase subunit C [Flavobacteriia bacterium]